MDFHKFEGTYPGSLCQPRREKGGGAHLGTGTVVGISRLPKGHQDQVGGTEDNTSLADTLPAETHHFPSRFYLTQGDTALLLISTFF